MHTRPAIRQARADRMSSIHREKEQDVGRGQKKSGLRRDKLIQPKFAKKAAQFMKSLGLIDKFKSVYLTNNLHASGNEHHRLYSARKRGLAATLAC